MMKTDKDGGLVLFGARLIVSRLIVSAKRVCRLTPLAARLPALVFARARLQKPAGAERRRGSRVLVFWGLIEPNRRRDETLLITLHRRNIPSSHSNRQPSAMISGAK